MSPFQTVTVINASETHVPSPPWSPRSFFWFLSRWQIVTACLFLSPAAGEHTHGAALRNNCCLPFKRPSLCCLFSSCLCSLLIFFFWRERLGGIASRLIVFPAWTYLTGWWSSLSIIKETPVQFKSTREALIQILLSQIPSSSSDEGKQHVHCEPNDGI